MSTLSLYVYNFLYLYDNITFKKKGKINKLHLQPNQSAGWWVLPTQKKKSCKLLPNYLLNKNQKLEKVRKKQK